jgi:hypothetical protein
VLGAAVLAGCGGSGGKPFPESERKAFVQSCSSAGSPSAACECALKKIEAKYSYEEFAAWSMSLQTSSGGVDNPIAQESIKIMIGCVSNPNS